MKGMVSVSPRGVRKPAAGGKANGACIRGHMAAVSSSDSTRIGISKLFPLQMARNPEYCSSRSSLSGSCMEALTARHFGLPSLGVKESPSIRGQQTSACR